MQRSGTGVLGLAGHAPGRLGGEAGWAAGRGRGGRPGGTGVHWGLGGFGGTAGAGPALQNPATGLNPPPPTWDKVFEYMALMKRVQEDDAGANKRKKKGDYVDGNDEEDLQASETQNEAQS